MAQKKNKAQRETEFITLFVDLNEKGKEEALTILQALKFAQSVKHSQYE